MMTLEEFLQSGHRNAYVHATGFRQLYVRKGPYRINHEVPPNVLQLANMEAENPGDGALSKLLDHLERTWEGWVLIECIHNERLEGYLERRGWERLDVEFDVHYAIKTPVAANGNEPVLA